MVSDTAARLVIDFGKKYIAIYQCDGEGVVHDEERFKLPSPVLRREAVSFARDVFNVIYDLVDEEANPQSARGEERASD